MSGFSADWLALRESADHAARSGDLVHHVVQLFAGRDAVTILDLGCGSGSNLRGLADHLPARQVWRLVDHDPDLLEAARERLAAWADESRGTPDGLALKRRGKTIDVAFRRFDLSGGVVPLLDDAIDLVTAAALFDLVSPAWIGSFVDALAAQRLPAYAALTYDGTGVWTPNGDDDEAVLDAFLAHQRIDKGLGAAAGPDATTLLETAFCTAGYAVRVAASPWRLEQDQAALIGALADGISAAVREIGTVPEDRLARWRQERAAVQTCEIGHRDLFAVPDM